MSFWNWETVARLARRMCLRLKRAGIARKLRGHAFARLWQRTPRMPKMGDQHAFSKRVGGREVETPVAVMPDGFGAKGRGLAWLSQQTIGKIKAKHPHVSPMHLRLAQKAADGVNVFYQGTAQGRRYWIGFARDDAGELWGVGWKRTADGKIYITKIHRAQPTQLRQAKKKWRREKNERLGVGNLPAGL